ncbi:MAG: 3-isopropylmalate dehydratase small subunit [Candidatus Poribacteria bacterium]|nr:MAG: 3-isopropylmalate dehydratase small subunit [Candidatus Poribacteria bacterium]
MQPFTVHRGLVAPLDRVNVDTDQIIPKQFLKRIERTGFGQFLFYDWRYRPDGTPDPDFVLNQPRYQGASILLTRANFGSGSSREHAPWALLDYGFRAIIAPSFADIFKNNCYKNGILPVELDAAIVDHLFQEVWNHEGYELTVDLPEQVVIEPNGTRHRFEVNEFRKYCLLNGLDDIGWTLQFEDLIAAYEAERDALPT